MVQTLDRREQTLENTVTRFTSDTLEFVVFCPGCKTMETLWFNNGCLMTTRKFKQRGEQIFHDCGTQEPCRLYRQY